MLLDHDTKGRTWQVNPLAADPPPCSLLKGTRWSSQLPAAALLGQGRLKPQSEVKPLGAGFQQFPLSQPLGPPYAPPNCKAYFEEGERPLQSPEPGNSAREGGQAIGISCLRRTSQQLGWTPGSQFVRLSLIFFLSLVSSSLELFPLHQQFMETVVLGEERRGEDAVLVPSRAWGGLHGHMPTPSPQIRSPCQTASRGVLSRPLGTNDLIPPLPETTIGSFPPIQNLPFFIPSAKVWEFCAFQPSSFSLQGSLQERGSR